MAKKTIHNDAATLARYISYEMEYAARLSMNDAAIALQKALNEATREFERGATRFTQKSFVVSKFAKKGSPEQFVTARDKQDKYVGLAKDGGIRIPGQRGIRMPGIAMKTNEFGNIPRGYIKRIEPRLGKPPSPGGRRGAVAGKLFRGTILSRHGDTLNGIFEREIMQKRTKTQRQEHRLKALILFTDKPVKYTTADDFSRAYKKAHDKVVDDVFAESMKARIWEINTHGRVLKKSERK